MRCRLLHFPFEINSPQIVLNFVHTLLLTDDLLAIQQTMHE